MKYIMFETRLAGVIQKIPVIFPNQLVHEMVAKALIKGLGNQIGEPVNAGEFNALYASLNTSGKSDTLGLVSNATDADIIEHHDYLHGLVY